MLPSRQGATASGLPRTRRLTDPSDGRAAPPPRPRARRRQPRPGGGRARFRAGQSADHTQTSRAGPTPPTAIVEPTPTQPAGTGATADPEPAAARRRRRRASEAARLDPGQRRFRRSPRPSRPRHQRPSRLHATRPSRLRRQRAEPTPTPKAAPNEYAWHASWSWPHPPRGQRRRRVTPPPPARPHAAGPGQAGHSPQARRLTRRTRSASGGRISPRRPAAGPRQTTTATHRRTASHRHEAHKPPTRMHHGRQHDRGHQRPHDRPRIRRTGYPATSPAGHRQRGHRSHSRDSGCAGIARRARLPSPAAGTPAFGIDATTQEGPMAPSDPRQTKFVLDESRIPRAWYNIAADLPVAPPAAAPSGHRPADRAGRPGAALPDGAHRAGRQPRARDRDPGARSATPIGCTGRARSTGPTGSRRRSIRRPTSTTSTRAAARRAATSRTRRSPQAYYNKEEGVTRLATETGAGQWGSALAFAGALFGLEVKVYMVRASYDQKPYRRILMETYGAEVVRQPQPSTRVRAQGPRRDPGPHRLARHRDQRGDRGHGDPPGHEVLARLGVRLRPPAPDGHRPGGDRADGHGGRGARRHHRLRRRRLELRRSDVPVARAGRSARARSTGSSPPSPKRPRA